MQSDSLSAHPPKLVSPFSSSGLSWPLGSRGEKRKPREPESTSQFHCPQLSYNLTPFTAQVIFFRHFVSHKSIYILFPLSPLSICNPYQETSEKCLFSTCMSYESQDKSVLIIRQLYEQNTYTRERKKMTEI